jgi:hypothetical protein
MLPKIGPSGLQRFICSANFNQQLSVELLKIVSCRGSGLAVAVKSPPAFNPR